MRHLYFTCDCAMPMATPNIGFHQSTLTHRQLLALLVLLGMLLLLSGCRTDPEDPNQPTPDILATLPEDWQVVYNDGNNPWYQVNIDDDTEFDEYLLFYTYNNENENNSGPTGASIFDLQNNDELVPKARVVSMPYQPAGAYVPYRVLPNYWKGSGTGFIAPTGRQGSVTVTTIERSQERNVLTVTPVADDNPTPEVEVQKEPVKELLIQDDGQTITIVWWRDLFDGYGAANVHAASGFKNEVYEDGDKTDTPLISFSGYHPFSDRSELCHETFYEREYLTQTVTLNSGEKVTTPTVNIVFSESPRGIDFCNKAPTAPFYPEAVVVKYLLYADLEVPLPEMDTASQNEVAIPLAEAIRNGSKLVEGLYGPSEIRFDNRDGSPATVCLSLIDVESGTPEAYRFRLNHIAPNVAARTTDQFKIVNVQPIPAPPDGPPVDCNTIVENGTPGRVPVP